MALGQENLTSPLSSVLQWLLPTKEVIRGDCFAYLSLLHVSDYSCHYRQQAVTWGDHLAYLSPLHVSVYSCHYRQQEVTWGDCLAYLSLLHVSDHSGYYRQQEVTWVTALLISLSLSLMCLT